MEAVLTLAGAALDLRQVPLLLERLAYDAPCFVGVTDAELRPVFVNPFGRRMLGLADDFDVTALSVPEFFDGEDRETVARIVLPSLLATGSFEGEFRFRHFGGRAGALVKWSAFLLHDARGQAIGAACVTTDLAQRQETEARLRESRARLKAAVDLVGVSSYRWDPQTGALEWDQRLRALWGVPPGAEVNYDLWLQGVHPEDRQRVQAAADGAMDPAGDGVYAIDYRVIGLNGGPERWISTYGQTSFERGLPVSFTGAVLDVTEQKRTEGQLRRSESYLATILRQLPVGVSVFDVEGRLVISNPAAERFRLGVMPFRSPQSRGRWRGFRTDGAPLAPADHPGARALRGETTFPGAEFLYSPEEGVSIWARVGAAPLRDADGVVRGVVAIIEDVDQQRRNEARLRETEERFRRFAENSSDVIWIYDVAGQRLDYLSPAFEQTWGRRPEEAIVDPELWSDSIHPDDRDARTQALARVSDCAEPIAHEYRIVRPDGAVRWIRDTSFPIRDAEGRPTQIGGIAHDMSSREPLSVYVVEPDDEAREAKAGALRRAGRRVATFTSEAGFLDVAGSLTAGCVLVRIGEASAAPFGLARALRARRDDLPVIFEAALHGDVDLAIAAMKAGAADVLKAPAETQSILASVASALANVRETERDTRAAETARGQIALMSPREREVLEGLLMGGTNKTIARDLGISPRTVEIHRARVMERLGVHTVPEAVLAATSAGVKPARRQVDQA